jgi:hypothetical protein
MLSGKTRRLAAALMVAGALGVAGFVLFGSPVGAAPGDHGNSPAQQTYTDPQPPSNGDFSGHGANTHGPYDSTRDGAASQNGKGDGTALGKPCAGCVGKADNKNPQGQLPGGSDPNAGYECDRNQGVGQGNPAHTSCTQSTTSPSPSPSPSLSPSCTESCSSSSSTSSSAPENSSSASSSSEILVPGSSAAQAAAAQQQLAQTGTPTGQLLLAAGISLGLGAATLSLAAVRRRGSH